MRLTCVLVVLAIVLLTVGGCGQSPPFPLVAVNGTVKYEDGSLIPADQIHIVFEPQGVERIERIAPAPARGYVDVSDGTFQDLTTWKYGDGAIVGRHKVTLMSSRLDERGLPRTTTAVPRKYHQASTTPLEVEVVRRGTNNFTLQVSNP